MSRTVGELAGALERLASSAVYEQVKNDVAVGLLPIIKDEFARSRDPYETPWAALKDDRGPRLGGPLLKTGETRDSAQVVPTATGVRASINTAYAWFQNYGTRFLTARRILPTADEVQSMGLPQKWRLLIDGVYRRAARRALQLEVLA